jgi:hypothetical protein
MIFGNCKDLYELNILEQSNVRLDYSKYYFTHFPYLQISEIFYACNIV